MSHRFKIVCVWRKLSVYLESNLVVVEDVLKAGHVVCVPLSVCGDGGNRAPAQLVDKTRHGKSKTNFEQMSPRKRVFFKRNFVLLVLSV